jgi:hypothetical protein
MERVYRGNCSAEIWTSVPAFRDGGIEPSIGYNTVVGASRASFWLDPYDEKAFGTNHKYLKYDVAEARKLLSAAGAANASFDFIYNGDNLFGAAYARTRDDYGGLLNDVGLKPRMKGVIYREYNDNHYGYLKRSIYGNSSGFNGLLLIAERPTQPGLAALRHRPPRWRRLPRRDNGRQERVRGRSQAQRRHRQDSAGDRPAASAVPGARPHPLLHAAGLPDPAPDDRQGPAAVVAGQSAASAPSTPCPPAATSG